MLRASRGLRAVRARCRCVFPANLERLAGHRMGVNFSSFPNNCDTVSSPGK